MIKEGKNNKKVATSFSPWLLALLCFIRFSASAQSPITIRADSVPHNITKYALLYVEKGEGMSIRSVQKQLFATATADGAKSVFIPFSDDTHWFKWEFENTTGRAAPYILQLKNELTESAEIYQFSDSLQRFTKTGSVDFITAKKSALISKEPMFDFTLRASGKTQLYVRLRSQRALVMNFIVYPQSKAEETLIDNYGQMAFINGALMLRLLLILILGFFIIKVNAFRAYSFLIVLKTLGFWGLNNSLGPLFTDNPLTAQKIDYFASTTNQFGMILLTIVLLPMDKFQKWVKYVLYSFVVIGMINEVSVLYDYNWFNLQWGLTHLSISTGFVMVLFAYAYARKITVQYYYAVPFMMGITSYFLFNLRLLTQYELPFVSLFAFIFFIAEILVFIFFLGKIFNDSERSKNLIQQNLTLQEQQAEQIKELTKLKTRFFTNVSHELKTPLTLISGPIQELAKRYPGDNLLKLVRPNLKRLLDLVNQLLDIQRLEAGKQGFSFENIDLSQHLRLHIFSFESMAEAKNIRLELKQNVENFTACVDLDKLNKIIDNLLSNAIKYSAENTTIRIKAVYRESPNYFQFSIKDEGFGIAKDDLPFIYDRFYRISSDNHEGSGIGLALVKELVNSWNGTIDVWSKPEIGTEFLVGLPVDEQDWKAYLTPAPNPAETPLNDVFTDNEPIKTDASREKELVLVVEDNTEMQQYLRILLQDEYEVMVASNGREGIEKADEEIPDLIISDLMMPLMDGFEFSQHIKNQLTTSHVPIIMLTAKASKESKLTGFDLGIEHYLNKPFDADELRMLVRKTIENRRKLRTAFAIRPTLLTAEQISEDEFISQLNHYLEGVHGNSKLTVVEIAASLHISDKQLRRKLKSVSEYSPVEYLRKFRLGIAAGLLKNGHGSVSEIAFETGFENLSYFSKVFQQEYGKLPSEYA